MTISDEHRELLASVTPVGLPDTLCGDCEPSVDGLTITHGAMCPVMISVDQATDADRAWFEAHPFVDHFYRDISWGESAQLLLVDERAQAIAKTHRLSAHGRVRVERMTDNARIRRFDEVYFIIAP